MLPDKKRNREKISAVIADQKRSDLGAQFAKLQRELKETKKSMLVIVDGWESSGKGFLLKDLTRELDPKYYEISVFESPTSEENRHPYLYRFFMNAPHAGQISFFDRSFYFDVLNDLDLTDDTLTHLIEDIKFVEEALINNDTLIVKFFLHQTEAEMKRNIEELEEDDYRHVRLDDKDYNQLKHYDKFYERIESVLAQTNYQRSQWDILYVDGQKNTSRKAIELCIERLELFLEADTTRENPKLPKLPVEEDLPLAQVDLTKEITDDEYEKN